MNFNDPQAKRVIHRMAEMYPVDHLWTLWDIVQLIRYTGIIDPKLDIIASQMAQQHFILQYFDKGAYYHLKSEVKNRILVLNEKDIIWAEHIALTDEIKENLYFTPFMIKCDDRDFLLGALEAALAEVKEPNWFDWYIELHSKGDDEGDYYEIKCFEEDD